MCRHAWACETLDDLLDVARTINQEFPVPLDDGEVVKVARAVWNDLQAGKIQRWQGHKGTAHATEGEIAGLMGEKNGGDGMLLLLMLRNKHAARVRRGETFAISCRAMAEQSLPWTEDRIRNARDVLLRCALIKVVASGKWTKRGRMATQYTFTELG